MPVCDGSSCSANIPWRITKTNLQLASGAERFDQAAVRAALVRILSTAYGGCPGVAPGSRGVVFKTLCTKCWQLQARKWGDPGTYTGVRAKTDATGLYFQVSNAAFFADQKPYQEAIVSCVCHELMHFWSFNARGLQDYNRTVNVDWDEVVADLFGYLAYKDCFQGRYSRYVTPYNQYPLCIERAAQSFGSTPKFRWGKFLEGGAEQDALPAVLKQYFQAHGKGPAAEVKQKATEIVRALLFESLARWFFTGPQTRVASLGDRGTCADFLSANGIQKVINTLTVFPAYGGGDDTEHAV